MIPRTLAVALLVLPCLAPARAAAETVLLLGADVPAAVTDVAAALEGTGLFVAADLTEAPGTATPALATLTAHDVVLVWSGGLAWDDAGALGDVLADGVDAGTEVVVLPFATAPPFGISGRFSTGGYDPVFTATSDPVAGDVDFASPDTDAAHPSFASVAAVAYTDEGQGGLVPLIGSVTFAADTGGATVAVERCDRAVIVLDMAPTTITGWSADAHLWLAQALLATQTDAPSADAGGPYAVDEGLTVALDGSASTAGTFGPITYAWDYDGDGAYDDDVGVAPTFSAGGLDGPTAVTIGLEVTDACGRTATASGTLNVANVAPAFTSTSQDGPIDEASSVALSASATDFPSDPVTYSWDFGDGEPAGSGASVSHTYADDGSYTVTVTASDDDGGSASTQLTVVVNNVAPVIATVTGDGGPDAGEASAWAGSASDVAGAADPLTWTWDWGDGGPTDSGVDLTAASHTWSTPGTYTVTVTVSDGDGGSESFSADVEVLNPGPTIALLSSPSPIVEGVAATHEVEAADVLGDPVTLTWDPGDGDAPTSGDDLEAYAHAWPDDGAYTLTVTATDTFGGTAVLEIPVPVANADPAFTASPAASAVEGSTYTATLTATDVAADVPDLFFLASAAPASALFDAATATFSWLPSLSEALGGSVTFEAIVGDGDGGADTLTWTVTPSFADDDGDGMADSWESDHGLDPTVDDSLGDPDADGVSNLDEWLAGTDPQVFGGPTVPVPDDPVGGHEIATATPTLTVANATDPDGDALTYDFEVYADAGLTTLIASADDLAEGSGTTGWDTADAGSLDEDEDFFWRARAGDGQAHSAWSAPSPFFVSTVNDPPDVPTPLSPDSPVDDLEASAPVFVVAVGTDPEGDAFEIEIELSDDTSVLPVTGLGFAPDGTWQAVADVALEEDVTYGWKARAHDERGAASAWSDVVGFTVDTFNTNPEPPVVVAPADGAEVATDLPELAVASPAIDFPDGDPLEIEFSLDVDPAFASDARQDLGPVPVNVDAASVEAAEALPENAVVHARARALDDRGGASAWTVWSFVVDAVDEAPDGPRVVAPADASVVDGELVEVRWAPAADPEDDPLTYALSIASDADGEELWSSTGLGIPDGDPEGATVVDVTVPAGAWTIRAQATDATGETGPWGPANRFVVVPPEGTPADLEPGEGPYGCDCDASLASGAGGGALWLLVGAALLAVRSGRRRPRGSAPRSAARGGRSRLRGG